MFESRDGLLPGLLPAIWRGIAFDMPDTASSPGRRIAEHLFPGMDVAAYDDMGAAPEEISVTGLIIGDDYAAKANALRAAFAAPGVSTLLHPWFGPLRVIAKQAGDIKLMATQLRVVRFTARFTVVSQRGPSVGGLSGAALIAAAIPRLIDAARAMVIAAAQGRSLAAQAAARRALVGGVASGALGWVSLSQASLPVMIAEWADQLRVATDGVTTASAPTPLAPAARFKPVVQRYSAQQWQEILRQTAGTLAARSVLQHTSPIAVTALRAASAVALAYACQTCLYTLPENRAQATTLRASFAATFGGLRGAGLATQTGGDFEDELAGLDAAIAADINEVIGRMPRVHQLTLPTHGDAMLIAHHYAGDDPASVEAVFEDIVARNNLRNPAHIEAGTTIEILR